MNENEWIEKYIDAAINYGKAQEEGNFKEVNKNAEKIQIIRKELKKGSEIYLEQLESLLNHDNDYVRLKASFDLLSIQSKKAENELVELSRKRGLIGFEAEMILQEWEKGNLK